MGTLTRARAEMDTLDGLPADVLDLIVRHLDSARDRCALLCALRRRWTTRNVQDVARATLRERAAHFARLARRRRAPPAARCLVHGCPNPRISFVAWLRPRVMTRGVHYCAAHVDAELLASAELFATEEDRLDMWR